ncbi:MAG: tRNA (adenosine(37)-N6)-threonylcarbamoyltransferase complex dimerization subunit type 1 TsaB [Acidobacteriota bacterium]
MWLLALETTTPDGSVALLRDDRVVAERSGDPALSHAERFPDDFAALLAEAGLTPGDIDLFAVATGPGGFTGLRIGLAAIQGLSLALNRPVAGVGSLPALAWAALDCDPSLPAAGVWLDASRGEVFAAAYARPRRPDTAWPLVTLALPTAAPPDVTLTEWRGVVPPGLRVAAACHDAARVALEHAGYAALAPPARLAGIVGRIGWRMHAVGLTAAPHALMPEYVRRPDVEIDRDRRAAAGVP